jgi:hypothetical protein
MPEGPSDPFDLVRGLEMLRTAFGSSATAADALPAAVERAGEVRTSIDRLTAEVAALNANVERALPVLEAFQRQFERALPALETIKRAETGIQQVMRRAFKRPPDAPGEPDASTEP